MAMIQDKLLQKQIMSTFFSCAPKHIKLSSNKTGLIQMFIVYVFPTNKKRELDY